VLSAAPAHTSSRSAPSRADASTLPRRAGYAALADDGVVAEYRIAAGRRQGAYTWYPSQISEQHALRAIVEGRLRIKSPTGGLLTYVYERHVEHPSGDWTWIGHLEGGQAFDEAIITFGSKAAFGSLSEVGKPPLQLTMRRGTSWLVETDGALLRRASKQAAHLRQPDYILPPKLSNKSNSDAGPAAQKAAGTVIDLIVGYTPGFAAAWSGSSGALTRLNFLVDVSNQAYVRSQISAQVRLVHAMQVTYPDNTDNNTALEELTGFRAPSTQVPPAPAFAALRAARNQYGADLVSLARRFDSSENGGCGVAWLIGGDGEQITASHEFFGYSVVSDGSDGANFCLPETLAHEMGHNMGSAHDVANSTSTGAYPYSYGYKTTQPNGTGFHTVMAYGDQGQPIARIFSNPRVVTCLGRPCGVANAADNARSLAQTTPIIATFRATVVSSPNGRARNDVNGDGRSDLFWRNAGTGRFSYWLMNGAATSQQSASMDTTGYALVGTGKFNDDGYLDLVWSNNVSLWMWLGGANGFSAQYVGAAPSGWKSAGAGDMDGDGRSDLLWRHTATGNFAYWLMSGVTIRSSSASSAVSTDYQLKAIGDFNGDGKADCIWDNNLSVWAWFSTGTGFVQQRIAGHPSGWSIAGAGDKDGDNKHDLFWRNAASGQISYWLMNGSAVRAQSTSIPASLAYSIATMGDFNGDSRLDIVWVNNSDVAMWIGSASGFTSAFVSTQPAGWKLIDARGP